MHTAAHGFMSHRHCPSVGPAIAWAFVPALILSFAWAQDAAGEQIATKEQLARITQLQEATQAKMDLYRSSGIMTLEGSEMAIRLGCPDVRQYSFEKRGDTNLYSDEQLVFMLHEGQSEDDAEVSEMPVKRRYLRASDTLYSWPDIEKAEAYAYALEDWKDVPPRQNAMTILMWEMRPGDPAWYAFSHVHMPLGEIFDRVAAQAAAGETGFTIQGNPDEDAEVTLQRIDEEGRTPLTIVLDMEKGGVLSRAVSQRYDGSEVVYEYVDQCEYVDLGGVWYPSRSVAKRTKHTEDGTSTRVVDISFYIERVEQSMPFVLADLKLPEGTQVTRHDPSDRGDRFVLEDGELVPMDRPKKPAPRE